MADIGKLYGAHGRTAAGIGATVGQKIGLGTMRWLRVPTVSRQFYFSVEVGGVSLDQFTKVSGFETQVEVEYIKEGGMNHKQHAIVKGHKHSRLVLEKAHTSSTRLWDWYQEVDNGKVEKKDIVIVLKDDRGNRITSWTVKQAYPVKWNIGELNSLGNGFTTERIEFENEGIKYNKPGLMDFAKKGIATGATGLRVLGIT